MLIIIFNRFLKFERLIASLAYMILAVLLLGNVLGRELFSTSIWGAEKIAVLCAIIAGFLGMSIATATGAHLRPTFLDGVFPARYQPFVDRFGDILSGCLYLFFAYIAYGYISDSFMRGDKAAVLYIPLWPFQAVMAYAFVSSALRHFIFSVSPEIKEQKTSDE